MTISRPVSVLAILVLITGHGLHLELPVNGDSNPEWSKNSDGHLFCNASSTVDFSESWWYCGEDNCNHCHMWPGNIITCSYGQAENVTLLTSYCATYNEGKSSIEVGRCAYNQVAYSTPTHHYPVM